MSFTNTTVWRDTNCKINRFNVVFEPINGIKPMDILTVPWANIVSISNLTHIYKIDLCTSFEQTTAVRQAWLTSIASRST